MRVPEWLHAWSGGNLKIMIKEDLRDVEWPVQRVHWVPGQRIFKLPILKYNCHTVLKTLRKINDLKIFQRERQTDRVRV